jgi:hypothetical protein
MVGDSQNEVKGNRGWGEEKLGGQFRNGNGGASCTRRFRLLRPMMPAVLGVAAVFRLLRSEPAIHHHRRRQKREKHEENAEGNCATREIRESPCAALINDDASVPHLQTVKDRNRSHRENGETPCQTLHSDMICADRRPVKHAGRVK